MDTLRVFFCLRKTQTEVQYLAICRLESMRYISLGIRLLLVVASTLLQMSCFGDGTREPWGYTLGLRRSYLMSSSALLIADEMMERASTHTQIFNNAPRLLEGRSIVIESLVAI